MPSFILRNLDAAFWQRVQAKAAAEGSTVKAVILRLLAAWLAAVVLVSVGACGYKNPAQPTTVEAPKAGVPTRIELAATPGVGAEAGSGTISARVLDAFATALAGQTLTFSVSDGATLSASSAVTDQSGVARATLTGPPGTGVTIYATVGAVTQHTQIALQTPPPPPAPFVPPIAPLPVPPPPPVPPAPVMPTVQLTGTPGAVGFGGGITFTATASSLNGETVIAYQWDLDSTIGLEGTTTGPTRTGGPYTTAGVYVATVKITTSLGRTATGTCNYTVTN
jgi:hypothetical protein